MPAPRKFNVDTIESIKKDFYSDMSLEEVGKKYSCHGFRTIRKLWLSLFSEEAYKARISRLCSLNQMGDKNSMKGRVRSKHPRYKDRTISTQGYVQVPVPKWYTGPVHKTDKVSEHILVACEKYGVTELPSGFIVHHKDGNKRNNSPDNLEILNRGQHMVTHRWLRHRKKVQRLSREGVHSKQSGSAQHPDEGDDIV